ncbi:MAG: hypothetical protein NUW00_03600, partial [Candidatus Kaiserbacteria bacterium]|nr:hypothetical protein [Candidatus Kaiserbacteria bacterium]
MRTKEIAKSILDQAKAFYDTIEKMETDNSTGYKFIKVEWKPRLEKLNTELKGLLDEASTVGVINRRSSLEFMAAKILEGGLG